MDKYTESLRRKCLFVVMVLAALCCLSIVFNSVAYAQDEHTDVLSDENLAAEWIEWNHSSYLPTESGNYKLMVDVTLDETWQVAAGTTSLDLNNHSIVWNGTDYDKASVIYVYDATLNLYDNSQERNGYITGGLGTYDSDLDSYLGGGVLVNYGNFYIYGGTIQENYATAGAGVYIYSGAMKMSGGKIINNEASYYGGGVAAEYADFEMMSGLISGNKAYYSDEYSSWGGGLYFSFGYESGLWLQGGTISNNFCGTGGGGVFCWSSKTVDLQGVGIIGNSANSYGGGLYIYGTSDQPTSVIFRFGSISENTSYFNGGGIAVISETEETHNKIVNEDFEYAKFDIEGGEIAFNTADSSQTGQWCGGAIYSYFGNLVLNTGNITDNKAGYGGAVFNEYSTCALNGGNYWRNQAITGGGAVCNVSSYFTLGTAFIEENKITGIGGYHCGGGIYNHDSTFIMNQGVIRNNYAATGGGIESDYSTSQILGGTISNNSADYGGGFYNYACDSIIQECNFDENHANIYGGAIFNDYELYDDVLIEGSLIVKSGNYNLNEASEGAAIFNKTNISVLNACITNNICFNQSAAVVESRDYPLYLDGSIITNNLGKGAWALHNDLILDGNIDISQNNCDDDTYADVVKYANGDNYIKIGENFNPVNKISVMIVLDDKESNDVSSLVEAEGRLTDGYKDVAPDCDLDSFFVYKGNANQMVWGSKNYPGESEDEIWLIEKLDPDNPIVDQTTSTSAQTGERSAVLLVLFILALAIIWHREYKYRHSLFHIN